MASSHPFDHTIASNTCLYCSQQITLANLGTLVDVNATCRGGPCEIQMSGGGDDSEIQLATLPYHAADWPRCPSTQSLETRPAHRAHLAVSSDNLGQDVCFLGRRRTGLAPTESPLMAIDPPGPGSPAHPSRLGDKTPALCRCLATTGSIGSTTHGQSLSISDPRKFGNGSSCLGHLDQIDIVPAG